MDWIDLQTPREDRSIYLCNSYNADCEKPDHPKTVMELVFSDEFEKDGRNLAATEGDRRWTAVDMYYSRDDREAQNYKPDAITTEGGALKITISKEQTVANKMNTGGEERTESGLKSGMLQSWNKFCFTGGYIDFRVKLPVDAGGLWPAAWLMGNLARAGYYKTTEGAWAFSTKKCLKKKYPWSDQPDQLHCDGMKGRGAPELDIIEAGVFGSTDDTVGEQKVITTMQMSPILPPKVDWQMQECQEDGSGCKGTLLLGNDTKFRTKEGTGDFPMNFNETDMVTDQEILDKDGNKTIVFRPGSKLVDAYSVENYLDMSWQEEFHSYGLLWEPGKLVRWYLDGVPVFEVDDVALKERCGPKEVNCTMERLIPFEPMYIILNIAIMKADGWAKWTKQLQFPATMELDWIRVYQDHNAGHSTGCDPPGFRTQEYIACERERFLSMEEMASGVWKLGACPLNKDKDFLFIASFGIACVIILGTSFLVWLLSNKYKLKRAKPDPHLRQGVQQQQRPVYQSYIPKGSTTESVSSSHPELVRIATRNVRRATKPVPGH